MWCLVWRPTEHHTKEKREPEALQGRRKVYSSKSKMKTSLRRLRGFTFHHRHGDSKDRRDLRPLAQLDEFAQAYRVHVFFFMRLFAPWKIWPTRFFFFFKFRLFSFHFQLTYMRLGLYLCNVLFYMNFEETESLMFCFCLIMR